MRRLITFGRKTMQQRHLISEAKFLFRRKEKELYALKQEMYYIEQFILTNEYIISMREKNLTKNTLKKLKHGQKNKKNLLKAVMGGIVLIFLSLPLFAYAADKYIIQIIGKGALAIEHDGVIHAYGRGVPNKDAAVDNLSTGPETDLQDDSQPDTNLQTAEKCAAEGDYFTAAMYYRYAGDTEKMVEMARKDIQKEYDRGYWSGALETAKQLLIDRDEIKAVLDKYLDHRDD